ncbi:hypothetical protein O6H91_22G048700 [Diphasiastrum complanatum]|uniref:Uncharacterized protein n=1 Tax=Diphasiastrum complanatum TaxID=34168 RepID=A0ACC2AF83_DIPCM|nr:hypothetical protein O6H91_22G048700 [Diphasiastrum complanatum]
MVMARRQGSGNAQLVVVVLAVMACFQDAHALTTFKVGGANNWNVGVDYSTWGAGNVYHIGDKLNFVYDTTLHDVLEVSAADYAACTISYPIKTYTSGNDLITIDKPQQFFVCGTLGHCGFGMHISVTASAPVFVSPPPPKPAATPPPKPAATPPPVPAATPPAPSKAPVSAPPSPVVVPPPPTTPPSILPPKAAAPSPPAPTPKALAPVPYAETYPEYAPAPSYKAPAISPAPYTETYPEPSPVPAPYVETYPETAPMSSSVPTPAIPSPVSSTTPTSAAPSPSANTPPSTGSANSIRCKAAMVLGAVVFSGIYLLL